MGTFVDSFKTPEVRKKILFTFLIVTVLSLLTNVPIPGLSYGAAIHNIIGWGNMGTILNILSGHALENISIVSLGIYPFLVASIVMQIVVLAVPKLRNLSQMGEEGQQAITKITRIASIISSVVFGILYTVGMRTAVSPNVNFWLGLVLCGLSVSVGNAFCGWAVELINKKGLGNGLTVIIVAGIIRNIPNEIMGLYYNNEALGKISAIAMVATGCIFLMGLLVLSLLLNMGEKKVRIIFSKRTVGMKQYGMQNQVFPVKVTQAGIMPVIYALIILLLPSAIIAMVAPVTEIAWIESFKNYLTSVLFIPLFVMVMIFFTFVFSMMQFNPADISKQIKEYGGYIQGVRPGRATAQYLMSMYTNLNVFDNFYLILVTVIPMILNFIPAFRGVCLGGIGLVIVGGGFIEMMTLLDNALKAEEDKAKMAGREKRGKNYKK